jgi:zinc transport system ATP-binding protein
VLDDLSFAVEPGTTLAIIGPSGSGKTILFKALIGAIPFRGRIIWSSGSRIGYVPQKLDLERDLPLTGLELLLAKATVTEAEETEVDRVLSLVDLKPSIARQPIGTLSGGQFQRLLLAFALEGAPTVLLFDEPTAGVDEPAEEDIYAVIHRLQEQEGMTVLFISHELSLVYRYADQVLCLSARRAFLGPPIEILTPEGLQEVYGRPLRYHRHDDAGG